MIPVVRMAAPSGSATGVTWVPEPYPAAMAVVICRVRSTPVACSAISRDLAAFGGAGRAEREARLTRPGSAAGPLTATRPLRGNPSPWGMNATKPRQAGEALAEENAPEPVLLGPVRLCVAVPRVIGQVLGHRLVHVEPNLVAAERPGLILSEREQPRADPAPLCRRPHGDVLEQQVVRFHGEHQEADDLAVPHAPPAHPAPATLGQAP